MSALREPYEALVAAVWLLIGDPRPQTARLRDVLEQIDAAIAAGTSRPDVVALLAKFGFTFTLRGFDQALYRLRKERDDAQQRAYERADVAALVRAARGMIADYEDLHGEGACDCRPEPENAGHVCNACLMRAALIHFPADD